MHIVLSQTVKYLLSYIRFIMPAHQNCLPMMLLPRYAALLRLFTQIFILLYPPCLREYIEHIFVLNSAVFIELYTIYYTSTSL
jgi:hypothetical protein